MYSIVSTTVYRIRAEHSHDVSGAGLNYFCSFCTLFVNLFFISDFYNLVHVYPLIPLCIEIPYVYIVYSLKRVCI
jgi:hypothetical protein